MQRSTCNLTKIRADETKSSRNETTMINGRVSRLVNGLRTNPVSWNEAGRIRNGSSILFSAVGAFYARSCPTVRTYELVAKERQAGGSRQQGSRHGIGSMMNDYEDVEASQPRNLRQQVLHDG